MGGNKQVTESSVRGTILGSIRSTSGAGLTCRVVLECPHLGGLHALLPARRVLPRNASDQSSYWPHSPRQRIFFRTQPVGCPRYTVSSRPMQVRLLVRSRNGSLLPKSDKCGREKQYQKSAAGRKKNPCCVTWTRRTFEYIFDGGTNLIIVDLDYPVEQLLANAERLFAHDAHRRAVAERANLRERDALALIQATRHRVPVEGLGTNDARARIADALDVLADARDEAAASDGTKDGVEVLGVGHLLEDLHPDGALAGDHERVVVRRDEDKAVRGREARAFALGLVKVVPVEDDLGTEARDVAHFDRRRALRHHDRARDAEARAREGDALRVVP